jgi:hypothetical protein
MPGPAWWRRHAARGRHPPQRADQRGPRRRRGRETADKIVKSTEFVCDPTDGRERAACPLCGIRGTNWASGGDGWTSGGLISHLCEHDHGYRHSVTPCPIMRAAYELLRTDNQEKLRADNMRKYQEYEHNRKEAEQEIERRRKVEPLILLAPDRKPEFFAHEYKARSPEGLARAEEKLREAGFVIERTDKVVAYRKTRDDWMMLADPRAEFALRVRVFKSAGPTRKRWNQIGIFTLRGKKNWPAMIEGEFQKIGGPSPAMMPDPLPEPKPEEQVKAEPEQRRARPARISMWDALQKQQENGEGGG